MTGDTTGLSLGLQSQSIRISLPCTSSRYLGFRDIQDKESLLSSGWFVKPTPAAGMSWEPPGIFRVVGAGGAESSQHLCQCQEPAPGE